MVGRSANAVTYYSIVNLHMHVHHRHQGLHNSLMFIVELVVVPVVIASVVLQ